MGKRNRDAVHREYGRLRGYKNRPERRGGDGPAAPGFPGGVDSGAALMARVLVAAARSARPAADPPAEKAEG